MWQKTLTFKHTVSSLESSYQNQYGGEKCDIDKEATNNKLQKEIESQTKCGLVVDTLPRPPTVSLQQYFIISPLLFTSLEQKVLRAYTPGTLLGTWLCKFIRNSKAGSRCLPKGQWLKCPFCSL